MPVIELDYAPFDYQVDLHTNAARFKVVVGGRRVGKSKMALQELIRHCLGGPNRTAWWVGPTHTLAREVGYDEFRLYQEALKPAIASVNEALGRVRFKNGSTLYFKGADAERSLRGRGLTMVVVDEAAFVKESVWTQALMPALADKKGQALLVSTPNGRGNWLYKIASHALSSTDGLWGYWHWPSMLNPVMTPEEMEIQRAGKSDIDFRQEFLAEFVTRGGYVYDEFNDENVIFAPPGEISSPSAHDHQIFLGMDFGYANPAAVCFMAVDMQTDEVIQFDEVYGARMRINEIEAHVVAKLQMHGLRPEDVKAVYCDPAGNAEDLQQGISPVDFLRMSPYRWKVVNKKSEIAPGLALVRSFIRTSDGRRHFFVTNNCVKTIESLQGYSYDKREGSEVIREEALKDGKHDHMCDAIRYFFVNRFNQVKWVAETPEQSKYSGDDVVRKVVMKRCARCRAYFPSRQPKNMPPFECRGCLER